MAGKDSVETICMVHDDCRTLRVVTGPMNFKKIRIFSADRAPGILGPLATIRAPYLTL